MERTVLSLLLAANLILPVPGRAEPHAERLPQLMDRLAKSQAELDTKQDMLLTYAKRNIASIRTKPWVEERLRDLVASQGENTRLYTEYRATLQIAGAAAANAGPRVVQLENEQSKLGANHMELSQFFGPFWERSGQAGVPGAPGNSAPPVTVAAAPPAGVAPPPGLIAPMPGTPPPFGGQATPEGADAGPAASTDAPAPVALTPENHAATMPAPPDDGEAAYKKQISDIQSTLTSDSATPDAKAKAYQEFLKLKTTRRERFK